MTHFGGEKRVIALDVRSQNFGFVVFEGPNEILDWGVRSFRSGDNAVKIPAATKLLSLLDEFTPSAVVIRERATGRSTKKPKLLSIIERQVRSRRIPVRLITPREVNRAFVGFESNKYEVASALAKQFPSLTSRLPPKRKCWQSEDYRMGIFDAAAVGVAYFSLAKPITKDRAIITEPNTGAIRGQIQSKHSVPTTAAK